MASKTTTVSPAGAIAAGCSATCDSYYSGIKPPSYQGAETVAYTNYQVVATGVGNWRPKRIKVTHAYTYSDGTTGGKTITYRSSDYGDTNPWSFPAVKEYSNWENPFEFRETDPGTVTQLRTVNDTITGVEVEFEESTPPTPTSYTITTAVSPAGSGTATGGGTFNSGASCTLTATPASGYSFVRWEKNGAQVSTSASYTFTVSESAAYTAIFESAIPLVHIVVVTWYGFDITLNGTHATQNRPWTVIQSDFAVGDSITITASAPNPTLNPFKAWYLNPSAWGNPEQTGTLVPGAGATYTFTATVNATYFATFNYPTAIYLDTLSKESNPTPAPDAVVSADGNTDNTNEFDYSVVPGSSVNIEASEYGGEVDAYHFGITKLYFGEWQDRNSETAVSTNRQYTFTTLGQSTTYNLRAIYYNFAPLHTAVMPNASMGTVAASPTPRDGNYFECWTNITFTAVPSAGYRFVKWTKWMKFPYTEWEEDITTNNQFTIEVNIDSIDYTYRAYFEWDGTDLLVNSANLGSPVQLVYDPATNKLVADY